jgi:hypothetical protein
MWMATQKEPKTIIEVFRLSLSIPWLFSSRLQSEMPEIHVSYFLKSISQHAMVDISSHAAREPVAKRIPTILSPPGPSINHNATSRCDIHHGGAARWFFEGCTFRE